VACAYVQTIVVPEQARHVIDRALRIARALRTVTCVIVPNDLQLLDAVEAPPHAHGTVHSGLGYCEPVVVPREADLRRAADVLNAGEKVAMLVGAGALGAAGEVVETAERLGAGVAKALLGKAVLPDDLPYVTGAIGLLGTQPSWDLMRECDTLLIVGSRFPYSEFLPPEGQARGVQIDLDPTMLALRYPTEVNLVGDAAATLRALLPLLERKAERAWRARVERGVREWNDTLAERARNEGKPINPQRVFTELSPRLPDGCVVTADSGTVAGWLARDVRVRAGMQVSLSGGLATMGSAVPYAIAAKFAEPGRVAIALAGDGAMQMNGNAELVTVAEYWREWRDPRLIVLVLNNRDLNMVTWEQRALAGDPKFSAMQDVIDFPYARHAELIGLNGIRVERPQDVGPAWDAALGADRPSVIEAVVDPDVPLLPPHVTAEQARAFFAAMAKGDPDRADVLRALYRTLHPGAGAA
jgi:pyruvate dehydrogenase (quinone)